MRVTELVETDKASASDCLLLDNNLNTKKITFENLQKTITDSFDTDLDENSDNGITNKAITIAMKKSNDVLEILEQSARGVYKGRNLADIFDGEISRYSSEWEWVKDRIDTQFYDGLFVCDYIPFTLNGERVEEQIAGICSYKGSTDQGVGNHIDFISRDCYSVTTVWNSSGSNNGNASNPCPYMVSDLRTWLNNTVYELLPLEIKSKIVTKRALLEKRYSASGTLAQSIEWSWQDIGNLWVPSEFEVYGTSVWGTVGWSAGQPVQYPIFTNGTFNRVKRKGSSGSRTYWHYLTVSAALSSHVCGCSTDGGAGQWPATTSCCVPICFRIK